MNRGSVFIVNTDKDLEEFSTFPSPNQFSTLVLDGYIPEDILRSGELFQIWKSDGDRIFEGVGEPFSKIHSILFRSYSPLSRIPNNSFATLHVRNTMFPLSLLTELGLSTKIGTLHYEFTERSVVGRYKIKAEGKTLPLERLVMDYGSYVDCTGIQIDNLVLYTLLCAGNIDRANDIKTLTIVHAFNIVSDGEMMIPESKKNFEEVRNGYPFPNPPGLERIVIPEAQEFRYMARETVLPDVIGIIPSTLYPSRIATGIAQSRHPFEKSKLPEIVLKMYDSPPGTKN